MTSVANREQGFEGTPDCKVRTPDPFSHPFLRAHPLVFDKFRVVVRVRRAATADSEWALADGPGMSFEPVTYYLGPWQFLRRRRGLRADLWGHVVLSDTFMLRVRWQIAPYLEPRLCQVERPSREKRVGDSYDGFLSMAARNPLRQEFVTEYPLDIGDIGESGSDLRPWPSASFQSLPSESGGGHKCVVASEAGSGDEVFAGAPPRPHDAPLGSGLGPSMSTPVAGDLARMGLGAIN